MDAKYMAKTEALKSQISELEAKVVKLQPVVPNEDELPLDFLNRVKVGQTIEITNEFKEWVKAIEEMSVVAVEMQALMGISMKNNECFICKSKLK